ncbi:holin, toxin secretion/phage lysis [Lachnospiraceae bacterium KM106-2]|nr:holin, toxin secretion/phage lysis [Lachnospiraceae bacterium KM106-2]
MHILFGEFDIHFQALLILMVCDYISGVLIAIYKKEFRSSIGYKGIVKKVGMLLCITVARQIDNLALYNGELETRSVVLLFFSINETLSINENLNKIGISIPKKITKTIKSAKQKLEK